MAYLTEENLELSERFDSMESYISTIESRDIKFGRNDSEMECRSGWYGTSTYQQAADMARFGWAEGLEMATKLANEIGEFDTPAEERTNTIERAGGMFVMPAYFGGGMRSGTKYMLNPMTRIEKPIIRVIVNIGLRADVTPEQKMAKGVAIMALVARLERCGQRVELVAWKGTKDGYSWVENTVIIKAADQHIDDGQISYAFAHPSFQRRHGFRWIGSMSVGGFRGMGSSIDTTDCEGGQLDDADLIIERSKDRDSTDALVHYRKLKALAQKGGLIV